MRRKYHNVTRVSRSARMRDERLTTPLWCRLLTPQDEGVLERVRVVPVPHAGDREAESLVQEPRWVIRPADFQRRAAYPHPPAFAEHVRQQRRRHARPPLFGQHREVVDVQLVEHAPERAEANDAAGLVAGEEAERHAAVLEL